MDNSSDVTRRRFLGGSAAASAAAFQIIKPELVRGQGKEKLTAGIIGTGGRGTRGVAEMISGNPNVELVAMADLFEDQLEKSLRRLRDSDEFAPEVKKNIKVAPENRFVGYNAYKRLIDSGVDIVLLHTPPGWRPLHFEYAVNAGKHIFAEKPLATDCVGAQNVMRLAKLSEEKKLTVMIGAQRRSQKEYVETINRIQDGEIGEIVATYANWVSGPVTKGAEFEDRTEAGSLEWQQRAWYQHVWICGDQIVEQQHRRHQLGDGHAPDLRGRLRRRHLASGESALRQHLRPLLRRLCLRQRRADDQPLPSIPQHAGRWSPSGERACDRNERAFQLPRHGG